MFGLGAPEIIVIVILALVIFGPNKLPELGASLGKTIKEFKASTKEITDDIVNPIRETTQELKNELDIMGDLKSLKEDLVDPLKDSLNPLQESFQDLNKDISQDLGDLNKDIKTLNKDISGLFDDDQTAVTKQPAAEFPNRKPKAPDAPPEPITTTETTE